MNKRTVPVLSTTMMSIATAACACCVAQTANAAENVTSAAAVVNANSNVANPGFSDGGGILLLKILIRQRVMRFLRMILTLRMLILRKIM